MGTGLLAADRPDGPNPYYAGKLDPSTFGLTQVYLSNSSSSSLSGGGSLSVQLPFVHLIDNLISQVGRPPHSRMRDWPLRRSGTVRSFDRIISSMTLRLRRRHTTLQEASGLRICSVFRSVRAKDGPQTVGSKLSPIMSTKDTKESMTLHGDLWYLPETVRH